MMRKPVFPCVGCVEAGRCRVDFAFCGLLCFGRGSVGGEGMVKLLKLLVIPVLAFIWVIGWIMKYIGEKKRERKVKKA